MINVLEVNVDDNGFGGVYSFVLNIITHIDRQFIIDLCAFEKFERRENKEFVESYGGTVYYCGHTGNVFTKQFHSLLNLYRLVKKKRYPAIHIHSDVSYKLVLYSMVCKLAGAKKVIVHSHSTQVEGKHRKIKQLLQKLAKPFVCCWADFFCACSNKAADWMYTDTIKAGEHFRVINNGIDTNKLRFDPVLRKKVRKDFGLSEHTLVYGHIGRFSFPKNHAFLINVFHEMAKQNDNVRLWLIGSYVGDDSYLQEAKKQVEDLRLEDKVRFLGIRKDIPALMQAMDCFLLPSRFEGLPIVGVEAQAAGLPGFYSDVITREMAITPLAHFLPLQDGAEVWAEDAINVVDKEKRTDTSDQIIKAGFDIDTEVKKIEEIYRIV